MRSATWFKTPVVVLGIEVIAVGGVRVGIEPQAAVIKAMQIVVVSLNTQMVSVNDRLQTP